jgi:hypothetical protein
MKARLIAPHCLIELDHIRELFQAFAKRENGFAGRRICFVGTSVHFLSQSLKLRLF